MYMSDRVMGIQIIHVEQPSILVGTDMLSGRSEKELSFVLGKVLTLFLPVHVMAKFTVEQSSRRSSSRQ